MNELGRRTVLRRLALASAGSVALAGCTVQSGDDNPDPVVVTNNPEEMLDGTLAEARGQQVDLSPIVHNPGNAGDIEVTATAEDDDQTELASTSEVFSFGQREQKRVTLRMTVPTNTAYIEVEAARA